MNNHQHIRRKWRNLHGINVSGISVGKHLITLPRRTTSAAATLKGAAVGMTAGAIPVGEATVILTGGPAPRTTVPVTSIANCSAAAVVPASA